MTYVLTGSCGFHTPRDVRCKRRRNSLCASRSEDQKRIEKLDILHDPDVSCTVGKSTSGTLIGVEELPLKLDSADGHAFDALTQGWSEVPEGPYLRSRLFLFAFLRGLLGPKVKLKLDFRSRARPLQ